MKKIKAFLFKHATTIAALALFVGVKTMESACWTYFYQTKVPEEMNAYRM
ncbi:MAG: cyclic lactone autoinducer peptide [Clostridia bacterium]|nr:cyclic lactone autoinducer peptide [Clostridia bacterium]